MGQDAFFGQPNPNSVFGAANSGTGPDIAQQLISQLLSQVQPGIAADQAAYANLGQQLGALPSETAQTGAYQQALSGLQQGQLGIGEQQLGLQVAGNKLQTQLAGQQQGIETQEFGAQKQQSLENYMNSLKQLQGSQAQSGAAGAPGQARDTANLSQNFQTQSELANLGQQSEVAGFQEQYGGGKFGGGQEALTQQNLSLMAQANGLSEQQLVEQLQYGLAQNKESGISSVGQLLQQMGSLATGDVSTASSALAPIAYAGGVNPIAGGVG